MSLIPPHAVEDFLDMDGGRVRLLRSAAPSDTELGDGSAGEGESLPDRAAADCSRSAPLLLLHGGGNDNAAISWYETFAAMDRSRSVIAFDLPGFGRTEGIEPVGGAPEMADFTARLARALDLGPAVVVGVSMGGDVALNLALRHPGMVEALVLIAPGGLVPVFRNRALQFCAWSAAQLPDTLLAPMAALANRHVERAIRAVVKDPSTLPPAVLDEFVREARRPGAGMGYGRYNQASLGPFSMRNDVLPVAHRIAVTTLFFHGADDPLVPPEGSARASALMPEARLVLVPDCGHWAQLEAAERFFDELRSFLEESDRRTGGQPPPE